MPDEIDAIVKQREALYGGFVNVAQVSHELRGVMATSPNGDLLSHDQCEALVMIQHKIARSLCGDPNYADSWDDIAGYAKLVGDRLRGQAK